MQVELTAMPFGKKGVDKKHLKKIFNPAHYSVRVLLGKHAVILQTGFIPIETILFCILKPAS